MKCERAQLANTDGQHILEKKEKKKHVEQSISSNIYLEKIIFEALDIFLV